MTSRAPGHVAPAVSRILQTAADVSPFRYADSIARLCPVVLPYVLDTPAAFRVEVFNGRSLTDDAMDVVLSLATGTVLQDGVSPDPTRMRNVFPYYGLPYSDAEQRGLAPGRP